MCVVRSEFSLVRGALHNACVYCVNADEKQCISLHFEGVPGYPHETGIMHGGIHHNRE
jgi:hypothetical protein